MITEELVKKKFIHDVVKKDIRYIYDTQDEVIRRNFTNKRALDMARFLKTAPFSMDGEGLRANYYMRIFPYLRFLDIRYSRQMEGLRARLALYNRVVWGVLYRDTLPTLRYGLTEDIRRGIREQLERYGKTLQETNSQ